MGKITLGSLIKKRDDASVRVKALSSYLEKICLAIATMSCPFKEGDKIGTDKDTYIFDSVEYLDSPPYYRAKGFKLKKDGSASKACVRIYSEAKLVK